MEAVSWYLSDWARHGARCSQHGAMHQNTAVTNMPPENEYGVLDLRTGSVRATGASFSVRFCFADKLSPLPFQRRAWRGQARS